MSIKTRLAAVAVAAGLTLTGVVGLAAEPAAAASPAPHLTSYVPWIFGTATPRVNGLRIRSGPGTNHVAYGLLYRGDHMKVTQEVRRGSAGYWFKVTLTKRSASGLRKGFTGWVYASYLRHA
jgi:Bacterial SH3 domain